MHSPQYLLSHLTSPSFEFIICLSDPHSSPSWVLVHKDELNKGEAGYSEATPTRQAGRWPSLCSKSTAMESLLLLCICFPNLVKCVTNRSFPLVGLPLGAASILQLYLCLSVVPSPSSAPPSPSPVSSPPAAPERWNSSHPQCTTSHLPSLFIFPRSRVPTLSDGCVSSATD